MVFRRWTTLLLTLILTACSANTAATPTNTPDVSVHATEVVRPHLTTTPQPVPTLPPTATATQSPEAQYREIRKAMVAETIESRGITDDSVLQAMRNVPRHKFVPEAYIDQAYEDHPLPIGYGQTISQPYIVAWMTDLLGLQPGDRVLEIGTGSGYQAAVLAEMVGIEVYSIEIVPELADQAAARLEALGYGDVMTKEGDGYYGWPEQAPFDAIIVTAAPDHLPQPLVNQLAEDGRLVIPIGPPGSYQSLWCFTAEDGELLAENLGGVIFVPFTREGTRSN